MKRPKKEELLASLKALRDLQKKNHKVSSANLEVRTEQHTVKIWLSILIREPFLVSEDNDEVALEWEVNKETLTGFFDITDSLGNYYLAEEKLPIDLQQQPIAEHMAFVQTMIHRVMEAIARD